MAVAEKPRARKGRLARSFMVCASIGDAIDAMR
jgi:hypothetical protein